jgi:hypothetical protein
MATMQDKPSISPYRLKSPRTPVHLRENNDKPFDDQLRDIRNADPDRYKDPMKDCTFSPRINRSRSGRGGRRNVNDLLNWGQDKRFKQTNARLNAMMSDQCSFSPNINPNSRRMAGYRSGAVEDRLMNAGTSRDNKIKTLRDVDHSNMFRP